MKKRRLLMLVGCIVLSLSIVAICGRLSESAEKVEPVRIGVLTPMSGAFGDVGKRHMAGIKFAVEEINKAGGIRKLGGAMLEVIVADSESNPTKAATGAEYLISERHVNVMIGPYSASESDATRSVLERYKMGAMLMETTMDTFAPQGHPYMRTIAMLGGPMGIMGAEAIDMMMKEWHAPGGRVVMCAPDNVWGKTSGEAFVSRAKELGLNVVAYEKFDYKISDLTPVVLRLKAVNPTFVYLCGYFTQAVAYQQASHQLNFNTWLLGNPSTWADPKMWGVLGDAIATQRLPRTDTFSLVQFAPDTPDPTTKTFVKKIQESQPGVVVEQGLIMAAQNVYIIARALESCGSRDTEVINRALTAVKIPKGDPHFIFPLFKDGVAFDQRGFPLGHQKLIVQWFPDDRQLHTIYPANLASRNPRLK